MKRIGIVTDSSNVSTKDAEKLGIFSIPLPFYFDEECYYEGISITRDKFFDQMSKGDHTFSTSQPSPATLLNAWNIALEKYDKILYFPISSALSSSYSTAKSFAEEGEYKNKVFVVDAGTVSTPMHRVILDTIDLIEEGLEAEEIKEIIEKEKDNRTIYIAVPDLSYLKKGGRITPTVATLATVLNIKPVLKVGSGKLDLVKKSRGFLKAKKILLDSISNDFETKYKKAYNNNELYLMVATSATEEETNNWIKQVNELFPKLNVMCDYLSLAVCCHIGPGALGVGLATKLKK